ncbi:hypothetical protein, partial [Ligilactobacillus salivarius]
CRKNGENKRRTVMQKNFTLSVLNIIQPNFLTLFFYAFLFNIFDKINIFSYNIIRDTGKVR